MKPENRFRESNERGKSLGATMSRSLIPTTDQSRGDPMAGLFRMSKTVGFRRLWITGLLGAGLAIFAGNASAWCSVEDFQGHFTTVCTAPTVSITSPANGAIYAFPVSFPVTATVDNAGQSIGQVAFYANGAVFQIVT